MLVTVVVSIREMDYSILLLAGLSAGGCCSDECGLRPLLWRLVVMRFEAT